MNAVLAREERGHAASVEHARTESAKFERLAKAGDLGGALVLADKCIENWRALTDADPWFLPDLAKNLDGKVRVLFRLGRADDAMAAAQESVSCWRKLAADSVDRYGLDLFYALRRFAPLSAKVFRRSGFALREEGANVLLQLASHDEAHLHEAARDWLSLAKLCSGSGDSQNGLRCCTTAVELWRRLANANLALYGSELAQALRQLAVERTSPTGSVDRGILWEARRVAIRCSVRRFRLAVVRLVISNLLTLSRKRD